MTDEEWELIADLVEPYSGGGRMGRPVKNSRRDIVNAIFHVAATGCQWRALPACYPNWNTVHRYHLTWSRNGTWEAIAARLATAVRRFERDARQSPRQAWWTLVAYGAQRRSPAPPGVMTQARRSRGARRSAWSTPRACSSRCSSSPPAPPTTRAGSTSSTGLGPGRSGFAKVWCDGGFKVAFARHCRQRHIAVEVVNKIHARHFEVLPRRWVVERTWSWLMCNRRLQIDYERDPKVTEGFVWAAHSRLLLRRLTEPAPT